MFQRHIVCYKVLVKSYLVNTETICFQVFKMLGKVMFIPYNYSNIHNIVLNGMYKPAFSPLQIVVIFM